MAALYLHNALFSTEPSPTTSSPSFPQRAHSRNHSTLSAATLYTATSHTSHPTEPLLAAAPHESSAYLDLLSRQPPHPDSSQPGWDPGLNLEGDPVTLSERRARRTRTVRRKLRRLRWSKAVSEFVIGAWATYCTVRYFIAFSVYHSFDRQIISLVLGSCAALSLACLFASTFLSIFFPAISQPPETLSFLFTLRTLLPYISSILLFAPAVVSFVLLFPWRHSSEEAQSIQGRCHWDIDVVWSGTGFQCDAARSPPWGAWVAASVVRLVLTAFVVIVYHFIARVYAVTKRPSRVRPFRTRPRPGAHSSTTMSSSQPITFAPYTPTITSGPSLFHPSRSTSFSVDYNTYVPGSHSIPGDDHRHNLVRTASGSRSLRSSRSRITAHSHITGEAAASVSRSRSHESPSLRPSHPTSSSGHPGSSSGHGNGPSGSGGGLRLTGGEYDESSSSSSGEDEDTLVLSPVGRFGWDHSRPLDLHTALHSHPQHHHQHASGSGDGVPEMREIDATPMPSPDDDLQGFVRRFRSLVSQINRETEEGLEYSSFSSSPASDRHQPHGPSRDAEYGDPERPDDREQEHVIVLGGYVRRMSTIESLGSREVGSSVAESSVHRGSSSGSGDKDKSRGSGNWAGSGNGGGNGGGSASAPPSRSGSLRYAAVERSASRANTLGSASDAASSPPSRSGSVRTNGRPGPMVLGLELVREPSGIHGHEGAGVIGGGRETEGEGVERGSPVSPLDSPPRHEIGQK